MTNIVPYHPIEHNNQRILTTEQLAKSLGTKPIKIQQNFANNQDQYIPNVDYYCLEGSELKDFINLHFEIFEGQNPGKIRKLYLWTERGAWLHTKSLNTDQAWTAYKGLVDTYYQQKATIEKLKEETKQASGKPKKAETKQPKKPVERIGKEPPWLYDPRQRGLTQEIVAYGGETLSDLFFEYLLWMNEPLTVTQIRSCCEGIKHIPSDMFKEVLEISVDDGKIETIVIKKRIYYQIPEHMKPQSRAMVLYED